MRLFSFRLSSGRATFGFEVHPGILIDLPTALSGKTNPLVDRIPGRLREAANLQTWLSADERSLEVARELLAAARNGAFESAVVRLEAVTLLPPVTRPGKIIAIGLNYRDHAEEQGAKLPENPLIFAKFPTALNGPGAPIVLPRISAKVDPEAELCVVMLKTGKAFTEASARAAIAGYTAGIDVSARDLQYSDKQWVRGKSCDTFAPCGPALVTEDELGDPHHLAIELRVNGETRQSSNTNQLIFNCYTLVSYISQAITLEAGDLIYTGTPAGVGVFRTPPVFLQAGDTVEVTIEKIGTLRSPVVAE